MIKDEDDVWAAYVKSVKPIAVQKIKRASSPDSLPAKPKYLQSKSKILRPSPQGGRKAEPHDQPLDHNLEKKLRQGVVSIDARIDLHGMKQDEAHQALENFLAQQAKAGRRCLLIITGKGRGNEGVLRNNLGKWLAASLHARHILALRPAALKHGGAGAFYVLLRRVTK
jgi:DNA-nicking Smr family endonuclease